MNMVSFVYKLLLPFSFDSRSVPKYIDYMYIEIESENGGGRWCIALTV
jgi:hypothetical protein